MIVFRVGDCESRERIKTTLISRRPHVTSHWFGQMLAQWAGVEFVEVPEK
jgi:hypothetical protein